MSTPPDGFQPELPISPPIAAFKGPAMVGGCVGGPTALGCSGVFFAIIAVVVLRMVGFPPIARAPGDLLILGCAAACLLAWSAHRVLRPWTVRAELHPDPDRLLVQHDQGVAVVVLDDVRAVREEPRGLRLLRHTEPRRDDLVVPTPRPDARALLVERLGRRGLAVDGTPRAVEPPAPATRIVDGGRAVLARVLLGVALASLGALWLVHRGWAPAAFQALRPVAAACAHGPLLLLLPFVPWLVAALATEGWYGRVVFREDRVEREAPPLSIPWADIVGHCVGRSPRHLQLVLRPGTLPVTVHVPTPTFADREAVLALLAARSISRIERPALRRGLLVGERALGAPLAAFEGMRLPGNPGDASGCIAGLSIIGVIVALTAGQAFARVLGMPFAGLGALVLAIVFGAGLVVVSRRWVNARTGTAELFADRVVVRRGVDLRTVFFADVAAFDDASTDVVTLLRRPSSSSSWARVRDLLRETTEGVPARDEATRTLLLDTLLRAGVPRGDAAVTARDLPPPRLVARGGRRWPELAALAVCGAGAMALVLAADSGPSPWWFSTAVALECVAGTAAVVLWTHLHPRRGRAVLRDDRVETGGRVIAWDDVAAFVVDTGHVRLVLRPAWSLPNPCSIPTRTAADLEVVRAFLVDRGVPEVED